MDLLIKNVTVLHKDSDFHQKSVDILLSNGVIKKIESEIDITGKTIISGKNLYCSIGLCDIGTQSGEPGYEHRETIDTLTKAALHGGFTALAIFPDTKPVIQTKADIHYLKSHSHRNGVNIYPIGALSADNKGNDIAEYLDMKTAGAVAFSQGIASVKDTGMLGRAFQYASVTDLPIIHHPDDHFLSSGGEMHEGDTSIILGMKGIPSISEIHIIQRDILLVGYNQGKLIEHAISVADSVEIIMEAKKNNIQISCTVPYLNLIFNDTLLSEFDTNLKVIPPLRSEKDRRALIKGLKEGTIDSIVSNHTPLDEESKNLEFTFATAGATGLETCLAACLTFLQKDLNLAVIIDKMTIAPRKLLDLHIPEIKVGAKADLCVFDVDEEWVYTRDYSLSKSQNNPFIGQKLRGKVIFTIV
ncbi:MAG: dihydroorotase [Saprospiraceae bacterium]|nr:dihydroorotase [Saprospiraceae bacterium]